MKIDSPERKARSVRKWVVLVCILVAVAAILAVVGGRAGTSGEPITFRIVDRDTGQPLTNVTFTVQNAQKPRQH